MGVMIPRRAVLRFALAPLVTFAVAGGAAGAAAAAQVGSVVAVQVIPRPHDDLGILGRWLQ